MQVIQARFYIVDIAPVAQGVILRLDGIAGGAQEIAPGIVGVADNPLAAAVDQTNHISLQICQIVQCRAAVGHGLGAACGIIGKVHGNAVAAHHGQLATGVGIQVGGAVTYTKDIASIIIGVGEYRVAMQSKEAATLLYKSNIFFLSQMKTKN